MPARVVSPFITTVQEFSAVFVTHAPGDLRNRLFVVTQPGDYQTTGRFWVNYTKPSSTRSAVRTVIASYRASANPDVADPSPHQTLLRFRQPQDNHSGGTLAFGPDNRLCVGSGDGGGSYDQHASAKCPDGNGQYSDVCAAPLLLLTARSPTSFGEGADGELYVTDLYGNVARIDPQ